MHGVRLCSVAGCREPHVAKGLCSRHYTRVRKHGSVFANKRLIHGMEGSRVYRIWSGLKNRCTNSRDKDFPDYGGRGIEVCERWKNSFLAFYEDMGDPPTDKHELDRRDNNKGYNKDNCRWVLHVENAQNRRSTKLTKKDVIEIRQSELSTAKLAAIYGVSASHIRSILARLFWKNV